MDSRCTRHSKEAVCAPVTSNGTPALYVPSLARVVALRKSCEPSGRVIVSRATVAVPYTLIMLAEGMTAHALDWSLLRYAGSSEMGVEAADEEAAAVASVVRRRVPVPDQLIVLQDVQPAQGVAVQVVIFLEERSVRR